MHGTTVKKKKINTYVHFLNKLHTAGSSWLCFCSTTLFRISYVEIKKGNTVLPPLVYNVGSR